MRNLPSVGDWDKRLRRWCVGIVTGITARPFYIQWVRWESRRRADEGEGFVLAIRAVRTLGVELGHAFQAADSLAQKAEPVLEARGLAVELL